MTYLGTPGHKNPNPGGYEFKKIGRPLLVIITMH